MRSRAFCRAELILLRKDFGYLLRLSTDDRFGNKSRTEYNIITCWISWFSTCLKEIYKSREVVYTCSREIKNSSVATTQYLKEIGILTNLNIVSSFIQYDNIKFKNLIGWHTLPTCKWTVFPALRETNSC